MAYIDKYGVEFSDDRKTLVKCPKVFKGEYIIPNSVTSIGGSAFSCSGLTSVTIPNSVTSIGEWAFFDCCGLTTINVSNDNPNYIAKDGVLFNKQLTTLIQYPARKQGAYAIPNSVTSIGEWAFRGCSGLTSVTIPNSVTSIGEGAFFQCSGLTSVTIPNSVTSIGYRAFYGCSGLTSVTIPNSVTSIGEWAFAGCSINVSDDNPNYIAKDGVLFNKQLTTLIQYPAGKQGAYAIPNSVTSIGYQAFSGCKGLTSIEIPNSVTSIGNEAFYGCRGLTSMTIGNSVTSIGDDAFFRCSGLTSVPIPNSVTSIGYGAFKGCSGLTSVTIPNSVTSIGNSAFYNCSSLTSVKIPNSVTSIGNYAFSVCSGLKEIIVPRGQKARFVKMNALSEYKNIIVEDSQQGRIRTSQSIGTKRIRSWEECLKEWDENKLDYRVKSMFGIHLTIDEYNIFKKENRNIEQIHGWCNSGKYIHEMERLCSHLPSSDNPSGVGNNIGLKTPRKGFYRIIDVLDDKERTLVCYYNYQDSDEFVEEEVEISSKPLYNKASIGPKGHLLRVDDILHVKEDVQLVDEKYDGEVYTAYKIVWEYEN